MTGPNSIIIAEPEGGHGGVVWERVSYLMSTYRIRRGPTMLARVTLHESLPFHSTVLDQFCQILHDAQGNQP